MTHMRAMVQDRYGDPDQVLHLREVDIPTPAPDEVFSGCRKRRATDVRLSRHPRPARARCLRVQAITRNGSV